MILKIRCLLYYTLYLEHGILEQSIHVWQIMVIKKNCPVPGKVSKFKNYPMAEKVSNFTHTYLRNAYLLLTFK